MPDIIDMINKYVRSELLVFVPILYILAKFLNNTQIQKNMIPVILMSISVVLSGLYTFSTLSIPNWHGVLFALFSTLVQGVLLSGSAVFSGIMLKLMCGKMQIADSPPTDLSTGELPTEQSNPK